MCRPFSWVSIAVPCSVRSVPCRASHSFRRGWNRGYLTVYIRLPSSIYREYPCFLLSVYWGSFVRHCGYPYLHPSPILQGLQAGYCGYMLHSGEYPHFHLLPALQALPVECWSLMLCSGGHLYVYVHPSPILQGLPVWCWGVLLRHRGHAKSHLLPILQGLSVGCWDFGLLPN